MKPEDLKNSINSVKPDSYMETRILAAVQDAEKPKKKNRNMFKAAVCTALCCAVLVAGIGIGIPKKVISNSNENVISSDADYSGNYFVMSVYAAESDKKTAMPIDDHTVVFPDCKLEKRFSSDGLEIHGSSDNSSFGISGENIKTVKIKCETGTLHVWDFDMLNYLRDNGMYYDVIVPYSAEYEHHTVEERLDIMYKHIQNGDYDEYIKGKTIKPYDEYRGADFVYDDTAGIDENIVGVGLVSNESFYKINPSGKDWQNCKEYTFQNVLNKTEDITGSVFSWNYGGAEILLDNPDKSFTALPHDTVSVEVTFNDGSVQYASYDFSFNDNGELVINRIAD